MVCQVLEVGTEECWENLVSSICFDVLLGISVNLLCQVRDLRVRDLTFSTDKQQEAGMIRDQGLIRAFELIIF